MKQVSYNKNNKIIVTTNPQTARATVKKLAVTVNPPKFIKTANVNFINYIDSQYKIYQRICLKIKSNLRNEKIKMKLNIHHRKWLFIGE